MMAHLNGKPVGRAATKHHSREHNNNDKLSTDDVQRMVTGLILNNKRLDMQLQQISNSVRDNCPKQYR
jgi:hypothetical protein